MKITYKQKEIIRKNGAYSWEMAIVNTDGEESLIAFRVSEEYLRFFVLKLKEYSDNNMKKWLEEELERIISKYRQSIFKYSRWNFEYLSNDKKPKITYKNNF